jgi:PGAP1-like protein
MRKPFYPIIYVRGYAMTRSERDETAADPFCGFNLGSTTYRASTDKSAAPRKFIFESPLLRLIKDFGYSDVYENGLNVDEAGWNARSGQGAGEGIAPQSVVVYRYYDEASSLFGGEKTRPIEDYAEGLSELILKVKSLVLQREGAALDPKDFRCYLVAHSMGGLVVRSFLQNDNIGKKEAKACVDKVFTYATPHNGIEILGNAIPEWFGAFDIDNFSPPNMAKFLGFDTIKRPRPDRVDYLPESRFPAEKFFCLIGTNRSDYEAGMGLSRTFAGHGSDGLVKIANASVWGLADNGEVTKSAPCAYVYRAHSGRFGIVNSEEAYQNLTRFLFGDIRAEVWLQITSVTLPTALEGKQVSGLYEFELTAGPRGKRWHLSRRLAVEDSPACRTHAELSDPKQEGPKFIYLSTIFLAKREIVSKADEKSLAYSMTIACRVPEYREDKKYWLDQYYEGSYLFQETFYLEATPPERDGQDWKFRYGEQSQNGQDMPLHLPYREVGNGLLELSIPFANTKAPGIAGNLLISMSTWNATTNQ